MIITSLVNIHNIFCIYKVKKRKKNYVMRTCRIYSFQFSSVTQSCLTLCDPMTAARKASLSITTFWSLLKLMSIELVMPSHHLILCWPLFLLPSTLPSIRVFSNESFLLIRWPKDWSFSISPSDDNSRLISFRMDGLDLLAVQGTFKSLLQHHSSKAQFFSAQLSSQSNSLIHTQILEKTLIRRTLLAKYYLCFLICSLGWP